MQSSVSNYKIDHVGASGELTHLYGQRKEFPDRDYSTGDSGRTYSNRSVSCVWVKNGDSSAITARKVLKWDTGTDEVGRVVVPAGDNDKPCGVANQFLPTAGAAAGEGFFMIVEGPGELISDGGSTLAVTDVVVTAASGKVNKQDASAATTDIMLQIQSRVGRPMEAVAATDGTTFRALIGPFAA